MNGNQTAVHRGYPYFPGYFWDHYTENPDIYDRFAVSTDAGVEFLRTLVDLSGIAVLDIATGTGRSAFSLARYATKVVGVEPDARMREFAVRKGEARRVQNVTFVAGSTYHMPPFEPHSFDLMTCFHGPPFSPREIPPLVQSLRPLARRGSTLVVQTTTPQWLHEFQEHLAPDAAVRKIVSDPHRIMEQAFVECGFRYVDTNLLADHGTMDQALSSYGFVYGPAAIDWILDGSRSVVPWGMRTYLFSM